MRAASPKIILERIREQWTDLADATIYRELEFEKQLWMLTGLKVLKSRIDKSGGTKEHDTVPLVGVDGSCIATKALSLYENQGKLPSRWRLKDKEADASESLCFFLGHRN